MARTRLAPWHRWFVALLLAGVVFAYYIVAEWIAPLPFYSSPKFDPEVPYFMSSLALFKGAPYSYVDHPGTPLEVVGTVLLALTRPWTRSAGVLFIPFHLENPRVFFTLAHGLLTLASLCVVVWLALRAVREHSLPGMLASAAVAVCYFASFPSYSFPGVIWWTQNAFGFPFGLPILLFVVFRMRSGKEISLGTAMVAGLLVGGLAAVQLFFLAWAVGLLVMLMVYGWMRGESILRLLRTAVCVVAGVGLGFFLAVQPVLHRYREFYLWIRDILLHQGRYGTGASGITSAAALTSTFLRIWATIPEIVVSTAIVVAVLLLGMWLSRATLRDHPARLAAALGGMALLLSLWLLIGKHWSRLYLLAVAAVLPLLLAIGLEALLSLRGRWRTVVSAISLAVILIFLLGGIRAAIDHFGAVHGLARAERAVAEFIQAYAAQRSARPEDLTVLWGYGTPTRCSALRYGDDLSGGYLQSEITSLCNNQWFYEDFSQRVIIPGTDPQLESNTAWDILILPENYAPHIAGRFAQTLNLADFGARSLVAVTRKEGTGPDSPAPKP